MMPGQKRKRKEEEEQDLNFEASAARETDEQIPEEDIPRVYICPFSTEMMEDPVTAEDGITYEPKDFEEMVAFHQKKGTVLHGYTGKPILNFVVHSNLPLKNIIEEFKKNYWGKKR